jgi:molybdopterin-binding protein
MTTYGVSEVAALLGVSDDTVRRWVDSGELLATRDSRGRRVVAGADLAAFAQARHARQDTGAVAAVSARNRLRGIVTSVVLDGVMAKVEMQAGPHRIVSLLTREAAEALGLEPGVIAIATMKSTDVTVGIPEGGHAAAALSA